MTEKRPGGDGGHGHKGSGSVETGAKKDPSHDKETEVELVTRDRSSSQRKKVDVVEMEKAVPSNEVQDDSEYEEEGEEEEGEEEGEEEESEEDQCEEEESEEEGEGEDAQGESKPGGTGQDSQTIQAGFVSGSKQVALVHEELEGGKREETNESHTAEETNLRLKRPHAGDDEEIVVPKKRRKGWGGDSDDEEAPDGIVASKATAAVPATPCGAALLGCKTTTADTTLWPMRKGKPIGYFCILHSEIAQSYQCEGLSEEALHSKIKERDQSIIQEVKGAMRILSKARKPAWDTSAVSSQTLVGLKIFSEVAVVYSSDFLTATTYTLDAIADLPVARQQVPLNGDLKNLSAMVIMDIDDQANSPEGLRWHRAEAFSIVQNCIIETKMDREQQLREKQGKLTFHKICSDSSRPKPLTSILDGGLPKQHTWKEVMGFVDIHKEKLKRQLEEENKQYNQGPVCVANGSSDEEDYCKKDLKATSVGLQSPKKDKKRNRSEVPDSGRKGQKFNTRSRSTPAVTTPSKNDSAKVDLTDTPRTSRGGESSWETIDVQQVLEGGEDIGKRLNGNDKIMSAMFMFFIVQFRCLFHHIHLRIFALIFL